MTPDAPTPPPHAATATARRVMDALDRQLLGQRRAIEALLVAYMAGGHALLEGVPGIGKTRMARSFAAALGVDFRRIQFTPDLMPADVVGTTVYDQSSGTFRLVRGPVFTRVLMADEINRTPPKTQAALLEAMQERQATIDGGTHALASDFFVIATQNPVEFEGIYPLPEAQLDRFLLRIVMGLPEGPPGADEIELYRRAVAGELVDFDRGAPQEPVTTPAEVEALRHASRSVHVAGEMLDYLYRLAQAVRRSPQVELGVSPRGALALLEAGRAAALLEERDFVTPDDLKRYLGPCWSHRMILTAEAELEGHTTAGLLREVAAEVAVPRSGEGAAGEAPGGEPGPEAGSPPAGTA
jgi:MoxR-like ATPase